MQADPQGSVFVLVPGAGGMAWYWHRVVGLLERAGRRVIAVDLPGDDENADFDDYADIVARAAESLGSIILVAQSLAGFTAPLVCERTSVRMLAFVNAMIPQPGERAGDWWENTGAVRARVAAARDCGYSTEFDVGTYFLHDVPREILRTGPTQPREQAGVVFSRPCRFRRWPQIPMPVIASANDRFFPLEFQRRVVRERLSMEIDVIPGGHLVALSNPHALTDRLLDFERELL
jgi:pimeloyl-ACP methyl ester carboxylesterase